MGINPSTKRLVMFTFKNIEIYKNIVMKTKLKRFYESLPLEALRQEFYLRLQAKEKLLKMEQSESVVDKITYLDEILDFLVQEINARRLLFD